MLSLEFFIKVIITTVIIFLGGYILKSTWTSQIDVPKSIQKILQKPVESLPKINDIFATRDESCIYQNGECVGKISGKVKIEGDKIYFSEINNAKNLKFKEIIEYKRWKIKLIKYKSFTGQLNKTVITDEGVENISKSNVYNDIECQVLE
jgi:hypothetical protein